MSDSFTLYKLIILFMLNKVDFPLNTNQISEFILEKGYTNYFTIQQVLNDLTDNKLITTEALRGATFYRNTEEGRNTLSYFGDRIPQPIVNDIITYFNEKKYQLKNSVTVLADYSRTPALDYAVHCIVREGDSSLIDLTLSVPDEETASSIARNWDKKHTSIYAYLMEELL